MDCYLCFPFWQKERQQKNPATDIQSGANRHLYAAEYGITITGRDGAGIAVCLLDHPLISLGVPGFVSGR